MVLAATPIYTPVATVRAAAPALLADAVTVALLATPVGAQAIATVAVVLPPPPAGVLLARMSVQAILPAALRVTLYGDGRQHK